MYNFIGKIFHSNDLIDDNDQDGSDGDGSGGADGEGGPSGGNDNGKYEHALITLFSSL